MHPPLFYFFLLIFLRLHTIALSKIDSIRESVREILEIYGNDVTKQKDGWRVLDESLGVFISDPTGPRMLMDEYGADPNARDDDGFVALHKACYFGNFQMVKILLVDYKSDIHAAGKMGETALHICAMENHVEIAKMLIHDFGANPNSKTLAKETPLHIAALHGFQNMSLLLVKEGSDIFLENVHGETPLTIIKTKLRTSDIMDLEAVFFATRNAARFRMDIEDYLKAFLQLSVELSKKVVNKIVEDGVVLNVAALRAFHLSGRLKSLLEELGIESALLDRTSSIANLVHFLKKSCDFNSKTSKLLAAALVDKHDVRSVEALCLLEAGDRSKLFRALHLERIDQERISAALKAAGVRSREERDL